MAIFVPRFLRQLRDVLLSSPADGEVLAYDDADGKWKNSAAAGGGVTDHGALTGLADDDHPQYTTTAEAQALVDVHVTDATDAHDASAVSVVPFGTIAATQVQAALEEIVGEAVSDLGPAVILAPASSARNVIQPTAGAVIAAIVKAHAAQSVDLTQWQKSDGTVLVSVSANGQLKIAPAALGITPDETTGKAALRVEGLPGTYNGRDSWWGAQIRVPQASDAWLYGGASIYFSVYDSVIGGYLQPGLDMYRRDPADGHVNAQAFIYPGAMSFDDTDSISGIGTYQHSLGDGGLEMYGGSIDIWDDWSGTTKIFAVDTTGRIMSAAHSAPADGGVVAGEIFQWYDQTNGAAKLMHKGKTADGTVVTWTTPSGVVYVVGGTDVALADGGTGASLVDPNADRIMFWDDSAGGVTWLTPGTNLTITGTTIDAAGGGGGAPTTATYITQTADAGLSAEQALSALATGLVKNTTGTGVLSIGAQGTDYYAPSGTDVAVADGGTGSSTAAGARTNLDVPSNAEAILDAIVDAKGDLIAATAADTVSRLAVGTDTHVLTADSTQATGIKWAAAGVAAALNMVPKSGWYFTHPVSGVTTGTLSTGYVYVIPLVIPSGFTVDRIGIDVTTAQAGAVLRLGIYADDGQCQPGALTLNAGTVDASSTGVKEITISQALTAGVYWLAVLATVAGPAVRCSTIVQTISSSTFASLSGNLLTGYAKGAGNTDLAAWSSVAGSVSNQVNSGSPRVLLRRV